MMPTKILVIGPDLFNGLNHAQRIKKLEELLIQAGLPDMPSGEETPEELEALKPRLIPSLRDRPTLPEIKTKEVYPREERGKKSEGAKRRKEAKAAEKRRIVSAKSKSRR